MNVISTTDDLAAFCNALGQRPFVAVDTEFMREKTYWPILCLIQAAAEGVEGIIDPMADGLDLTPFLELMNDRKIVKVFHAARQDAEIFCKLTGEPPAPLFDTQIAAMAAGFGDQIGYEPLMRKMLGAKIDKGSRFTDWARRPLSEAQLSYALSDVTHLREAYPILLARLTKEKRLHWVEEEMAILADPGLYFVEPEEAWKRLKLRNVRPNDLGPIMRLTAWREREAQSRDMPRNRILKDDAIFEIARLKPESPADLSRARSISSGAERSKAGAAILAAVAEGKAMSKSDLPDIDNAGPREPAPADIVDLLRVLLKRQAEAFDVAARLVASTGDLEALALDPSADIPAMKGWRREVFGDMALKLMNGELSMRLEGGKIEVNDV
jgi:ribonuclease D